MNKEITDKELKKIQTEILKYVHDYCLKNNIKYWLDSGTLLGAIRHKGYIPWDDDIDIGMARDDYNKFLENFNNTQSKYKCYSIENNNKFCYPYAKILDTSTILYEPDEKGIKLCVYIDLFPYDNAPNDEKIIKKMSKKALKYHKLRRLSIHCIHKGGFCRKLLIAIA